MGKSLDKKKELGEGISQRKDGRYCGRYTDRFGNRKTIYSSNLNELKKQLRAAIYEDENRLNVIDEKITLNEWYTKWLDIHKYKVIRDSSRATYISVFKKHISPKLGMFYLNDITHLQIRAVVNELDKSGFGFETKNKVVILLKDMYNKALIDDIVRKNPAKGIKVVRDEEKEPKALTRDEQAEFFDCCRGTFYDNLFNVAVTTGLRPGELCALTYSDIDFENKEISITKTLLYQKLEGDDKKTFHIHPPKTKTSKRRVKMSRQCEMAIKKQIMQKNVIVSKHCNKATDEFKDLLFTTRFNTPINSQIYIDAIKNIVDEINLTKYILEEMECFSGHCFRHTYATRGFESGMSVKEVQEALGHATMKMTGDLYIHVLEQQKQISLEKLEATFDETMSVSEELIDSRFKQSVGVNNNVVNFTGVRLA